MGSRPWARREQIMSANRSGPVAQGEAAPVFHQVSGGGAQLVQGAEFLAAGRAAAAPGIHLEIGRIGDN